MTTFLQQVVEHCEYLEGRCSALMDKARTEKAAGADYRYWVQCAKDQHTAWKRWQRGQWGRI